ncbi:MAG: NUDIX hydrolase N-terminal domain-containing protein [Caldilineaceae bacterium]
MPPFNDTTAEILQIANELRSLGTVGRYYAENPYQVERNEKVMRLAARLLSLVETRNLAELERLFFDDLVTVTPLAVVDTAVFDAEGRLLLMQRSDDHLWAMPGGGCEVNELPAAGGAREVQEETGYTVEVTHLIGVFDSRFSGTRTSRHLYHLLFAARVTSGEATLSHETLDVRWFAPAEIPWDALSPGHEKRIRFALAWRVDSKLVAFFDRQS